MEAARQVAEPTLTRESQSWTDISFGSEGVGVVDSMATSVGGSERGGGLEEMPGDEFSRGDRHQVSNDL